MDESAQSFDFSLVELMQANSLFLSVVEWCKKKSWRRAATWRKYIFSRSSLTYNEITTHSMNTSSSEGNPMKGEKTFMKIFSLLLNFSFWPRVLHIHKLNTNEFREVVGDVEVEERRNHTYFLTQTSLSLSFHVISHKIKAICDDSINISSLLHHFDMLWFVSILNAHSYQEERRDNMR